MKSTSNLALAISLVLAAGAAAADNDATFHERASVRQVVPVYEQVPVLARECHEAYEPQEARDPYQGGRTVLGAVLGGLVGSTVGKGDGRVVAAAVGAATGAVVGNNWGGAKDAPQNVLVERCRTVERYQPELIGYDVTYEFRGRPVTSRMDRDPGRWVQLRVAVDVEPSYR